MADGSIGLGPINMLPGDIVCGLGCSYFPVVLRKIGAHHVFVGCCYVYGLMDGEMASMAEQNGIEAVPYDTVMAMISNLCPISVLGQSGAHVIQCFR
jgi:hypothetical protein